MMIKIYLVTLLVFSTQTFGQELSYPELNVTPRASKRVSYEAKLESKDLWLEYAPIQLSSLMLLSAGAMSSGNVKTEKEEQKSAPAVAMAVGTIWLGVTTWAISSYRPYRSALKRLSKLPYKTKRNKLMRERLAEEELNRLKTLGQRVRWFSVFTNLAASGLLVDATEEETDAKMISSLSALMAFTPLFFTFKWESVADEQDKYKKRIYAPVAMSPIISNPFDTGKRASGFNFHFLF